ncbi:MAG: hypothetical protein O2890_06740 [Cyanobacteria bacterium]|nr:hypothetical protein [Cyanobacteriota bacterium]MDA0866102.1 hypothetical protein [Cyanobacteriota bacterium]
MLQALQQTVTVGAGGKIELLAPECPEGTDVQVIVLVSPQVPLVSPESTAGAAERQQQLMATVAKVQAWVKAHIKSDRSLVDELIAERRAEAERE